MRCYPCLSVYRELLDRRKQAIVIRIAYADSEANAGLAVSKARKVL
jgi:hypothetical protein